ncbi:MAG: T9SS type A sorting domain-containing protein [Ignavibacteria bacterium]|nr:T9SS type A sorting domain-containing protein [Ignavibacteria bacterium]
MSGETCTQCTENERGVTVFVFDTTKYFVTRNGNDALRKSTFSIPSWTYMRGMGFNPDNGYFFNTANKLHFGYLYNNKTYFSSSSDAGISWSYDTIPDFSIKDMYFINERTGYSVGANGLVAKTVNGGGTVGIKSISSETPKSFKLHQNFPNPFNPTTTITFDVARSGTIKLEVFDLLGKQIETMINEALQQGTYEISFDATHLSSGIYYYKLVSDNYTMTKKMVVSK